MIKAQFHTTAYASLKFLLVAFLFLNTSAFPQKKISGLVLDTDHQPVDGASIAIKNSNAGTLSAANGSFSIVAKTGDVLLVSSVGMIKREILIRNEAQVVIIMSFATNNMEEVMVIGYGTSKRKDITGAVAKLTAKEFNTGIITNPMQQLQGKVAGLVITQPGSDPNGDYIVRLRGATSLEGQPPLLVIDGVAIDDFQRAAATLNPADIESYDILKDASAAAIYGSRGANGVMLITTKKGRVGKTLIGYNGFLGLEKISNQLNVLSADQWRDATAAIGGGSLDKGANVDWQKAISQTGFSHSHTIGLSGGNDLLNFHGSLGYIKQEGVVINTGKEIITARLTANQKSFKDKLEIRYGLNTSFIKRDFLWDQNSTSQVRTRGSDIFTLALGYLPVLPEYNPDGSYYQPANNNTVNPLYLLKEGYSKQRENFFQGSVKADYEILQGLKAGVLGAMSRANDVYDFFYPGIVGRNEKSVASKSNNNKQIFSGDIHGNYKKSFGKHTIDITGVYEYNKFVNDGFGVRARGFLVPQLLNNNLGTATDVQTNDISSYKNEVKLVSFLGRAIYNFDDRYIITANMRRDGSSKFGLNNRWGNFPSVAVAWRANNENFLKNIKWLDNLKLRVSYGFTGNQENLPPYTYQLLYGPVGPYLYNGQFLQSYAVLQENNPDLKWEVRKSFNAGVDFSILNDRINGIIDVFNDKTSDMLFLYDLPQPPFLTDKVSANAASAVNKGVEITLVTAIIKNKNFTWEARANIGTLKSYITNLSGQFKGFDLSITNRHYGYAEGGGLSGAYITEIKPGFPTGVFWIPQHAGLDAAGHELYNNYDADGKFIGASTGYTDQDRVFIDPTADFTWGFTNNFALGNFDLSFFLRGVQGQKIFANSLLNLETTVYLPGNNAADKALTNGFTEQPKPSTYWLRDGDFTRLENLALGYNFKNLKNISSLRLYLAATNLFVLTSYEGIDPEIKTEGSQRYIDRNYYPKTRGISFGVHVGF